MLCRRSFLLVAALTAVTLDQVPAQAGISDADKKMTQGVFDRLVAAATPVEGWAWPPQLNFTDSDEIQAYATVDMQQDPPQPQIFVYRGILEKVIAGNEDRLALLLGHELSHITCGHVKPAADEKTPLVEFAATREQEHEADMEGLKLALAAGYSFKDCLSMITQFIELGLEYTSFESLHADHPSWKERLAFVDKEQAQLWQAMAAFEAGVQFLMFENYIPAERCFLAVTDAFPKCSEAWANLGYARLMRYCDDFDADTVEEFDLGPLVIGAFYTRPPELRDPPIGLNEDLWFDAVGALREALRLNPNSILAASNLGIAYIVRPSGKEMGPATKYLDLAVKLAQADESHPALARAAVLANAGIADLLEGEQTEALALLDEADSIHKAFAGGAPRLGISPGISAAILYHRAALLAASDDAAKKQEAVKLFEQFLATLSTSSAWWPMGYKEYSKLCEELKVEARPQEVFGDSRLVYRPISTLDLGGGKSIYVSQDIVPVERAIGEGVLLSTVAGTSIRRLSYPELKIELLAAGKLFAICLTDPAGPSLNLQPAGSATESVELKVGMSKAELDELLGSQQYDYRQLTDPEVNYRFYRHLGIAVRVKHGVVVELIIVQIPESPGST